MAENQVIFLNGASSTGKSSLARALQHRLEKPYLFVAEDTFFAMLPEREFAQSDYLRYGLRLYTGFIQSVRALVDSGNRVIVDTVTWGLGSLASCVNALWDRDVFAVGVHCPLSILESREQERKDRSLGLARKQFELVHRHAQYDVAIDTGSMHSHDCADLVVVAMNALRRPHAFAQMKQRLDETVTT